MPSLTEELGLEADIGLSTENFVTAPVDYSLLLDRWAELFPASKVLIVIRSQPDLIYSWYVQLIRAGYFRDIHQFTREIIWDSQRSIWSRLNYDRVARLTIEKFTDVKVLIYETMLTDYDAYIRELNSFFGRDLEIPNRKYLVSPSENTVSLMRTLNRLIMWFLIRIRVLISTTLLLGAVSVLVWALCRSVRSWLSTHWSMTQSSNMTP